MRRGFVGPLVGLLCSPLLWAQLFPEWQRTFERTFERDAGPHDALSDSVPSSLLKVAVDTVDN